MKYPFVVFYRSEKFSKIDSFFIENNEKLNCTIFITDNKNDLNKLFDSNYQILITYGDNEEEYVENVMSVPVKIGQGHKDVMLIEEELRIMGAIGAAIEILLILKDPITGNPCMFSTTYLSNEIN